MAEGVIRNFMVALGFKTDNTGLGQMQSAMEGIDWQAKALKASLLALATGAIVAVRQTAGELDKLYFSSQRIGASVTNINAYGNAIAQLGGSAEGAVGSLESIAEKMRNSPGYESMIGGLGVATRDANGQMRDRVEVMKDLSGVLSKMPAYQANAYAESLGIDQNTLLAMRDGKFMSNMEKYQKIQKELGMNDDLAKSGNEFMTEYRDLTMMTKTGFQVLVMQAGKALIPILRLLNQLIQSGIQAFSQLNPQVKDMLGMGLRFAMLALVMGGFIKTFGMIFKFIPMLKGFIGLLKLFRLAFLASPIGIILALAAAIGLLYDDYKTWRDGGKSLFDWSKWTEGIDFIIEKIQDFLDILDKIKDKTIEFINKVINNPAEAFEELVDGAKETVAKVGEELANPTPDENGNVSKTRDLIAGGMDAGFGLVDKGLAFFGNDDAQQRVKQRERGEIGYQAQTTVVKDMTSIATTTAKAVNQLVKEVTKVSNNSFSHFIGKGEGGYNSVNLGKKYGYKSGTRQLTKMTVQQVYDMQKRKEVNAVGKFQIIRTTMPEVIKGMGLSGKEKFDEEMQERMGAWLLFNKRKALGDYLKGKHNNLKLAGDEGAREWASLPVLSEKLTTKAGDKTYHSKRGSTAYSDGVNKAQHSASNYEQTLLNARKIYQDSIKSGLTSAQAQSAAFKGITTGGTSSGKQVNTDKKITNVSPPSGNPEKSHTNNLNSKSNTSNVTIHQEFKTDMTLNGVSSPMESAQAVKRQQENSLVFMARGVKNIVA